jgi:hypothetical protein
MQVELIYLILGVVGTLALLTIVLLVSAAMFIFLAFPPDANDVLIEGEKKSDKHSNPTTESINTRKRR